jgi:arylsulfatase A-like enzyme
MKRLCALTLILALSITDPYQSEAAAQRPNFIFILADDLGYGDLGCYGQKVIQTPNLDRMAAEGMRFTQFYAGSTVCAPSRSVLMTGLHTGHTRVRGNAGQGNPLAQSLRPEDVTVAKVLNSAGYSTALVGKWGLGDEEGGEVGLPRRQGFDFFFGYLNQHHAHNYYPTYLIKNESHFLLENVVPGEGRFGQGWATKRVQYSLDFMAKESLQWVEENRDKPFFLYLAYTTPHANNEGTRGTGNGQEVPDSGIYKDKDWSEPHKGQAAMITRMDTEIGRLFALLKKLNLDDKTLVFFSSDNGAHKEGGNDPEFFDANGPLRGIKRDLTDGGIRTPFIARWSGKIKPGTVSAHVGYFGDLMATLAELTGAKPPAKLDSLSLVPTLLGRDGEQKKHEFLYWEFHERGTSQAALMNGRWKGIRLSRRDAPLELYDLQNDIGEAKNVATQHPEIVAKIETYLKTARTENPDWPIRDQAPQEGKGKKKAQ